MKTKTLETTEHRFLKKKIVDIAYFVLLLTQNLFFQLRTRNHFSNTAGENHNAITAASVH